MSQINKQLMKLLATETFQKLLSNDLIRIEQLLAATKLLIITGIPFDLDFAPGTRRQPPSAELVVFINPTTTIDFLITLEGDCSSAL